MDITITAHLDTPVIGQLGPLDGPLAWAAWQQAVAAGEQVEPITDDHAPDFDLPLNRWEKGDYWGWRVSAPQCDTAHYSTAESRRKPALNAMALYSKVKNHHSASGPMKANNVILPATHHQAVTWYADTTDRERLEGMLAIITHLGARHRNGHGHITRWEITDGPTDGWSQRPMPADNGKLMRVRAPYWHHTEQTTCS